MRPIIFRCGVTGFMVQGLVSGDHGDNKDSEDAVLAVICDACGRMHLVGPKDRFDSRSQRST
jgi:hypothetical protein